MLGMDEKTHAKLGKAPAWADCLKPMAITAQDFFRQLHCTLPVNGGARENWPRVGLEAMAMGVPVVAQNEWGWREMIQHGVTGFLVDDVTEAVFAVRRIAGLSRDRISSTTRRRFSVERMVDDYEAVYRRLAEANASDERTLPGVRDLNGRSATVGSPA